MFLSPPDLQEDEKSWVLLLDILQVKLCVWREAVEGNLRGNRGRKEKTFSKGYLPIEHPWWCRQ